MIIFPTAVIPAIFPPPMWIPHEPNSPGFHPETPHSGRLPTVRVALTPTLQVQRWCPPPLFPNGLAACNRVQIMIFTCEASAPSPARVTTHRSGRYRPLPSRRCNARQVCPTSATLRIQPRHDAGKRGAVRSQTGFTTRCPATQLSMATESK